MHGVVLSQSRKVPNQRCLTYLKTKHHTIISYFIISYHIYKKAYCTSSCCCWFGGPTGDPNASKCCARSSVRRSSTSNASNRSCKLRRQAQIVLRNQGYTVHQSTAVCRSMIIFVYRCHFHLKNSGNLNEFASCESSMILPKRCNP